MALLGFTQDPDAPQGAGLFHGDAGEQVYAYHPELALQLSRPQSAPTQVEQPSQAMTNAAAPMPDQRLALAGFPSTDQRLAQGGPPPGRAGLDNVRTGPSHSVADVGANMGAPGGPPRPPADPIAPSAAGGAAPENTGQAIQQLQEQRVGQAMLGEQNAPVRHTPAHFAPSTKEVSVSDQGAPISPETAQLRAEGRLNETQGTIDAAHLESESLKAQSQQNLAFAESQKARIEQQQKVANETQQLVAKDRSDLDRYTQNLEADQKSFDPNRLFSGPAGTLAGIAAAIIRGVGAYAMVKSHRSDNPAGDVIDAAIQRDILQQKMAIESGRGNVDNALSRLTRHYGDMNQATAALSILQNKQADAMQLAFAQASGSQEVIAKTQAAIGAKQQLYATEDQKFADAAYGKHSVKVAEKYVAPTTTGGPPSVDKELERAGKIAQIRVANSTATKNEAEAGAAKGKGGELQVPDGKGGQITARSLPEAAELRTSYGDLVTGQQAAKKMIAIAKETSGARQLNPFTLEKERLWNSEREALMHAVNNALTGKSVAVREASMQRFEHALAGSPGSPGATAAIQEINDIISNAYQSKLDSQMSPGAKTPSITPQGATEYTGSK